jgi:hypothetical protein
LNFMEEHQFRSQLMARRFNVYSGWFEEGEGGAKFGLGGVEEERMREVYECCRGCGPCRFRLQF